MKKLMLLVMICLTHLAHGAEASPSKKAIVQKHDVVFTVNSGLSAVHHVSTRILVLDSHGLDAAVFNVYTDSFRKLNSFTGRIGPVGKNSTKLKMSDLTTLAADEGGVSDAYVSAYVPDVSYPFIVEYEYEVVYRKGFIRFPPFMPVTDPSVSVQSATYTLDLPAGMQISHYSDSEPVISSGPKRDTYKWEVSEFQGYEHEHMMPSVLELVPYVFAEPVVFEYAGTSGSQKDWKESGAWLHSLMEGSAQVPQELTDKVNALIKGIDDKKEIIRILYAFLRNNTRYVSIQLGIGGMKPFPVEDVYAKGYGDCKALSVYMHALLSIAGIDSQYMILDTGRPTYMPGLYSVGQMDHAMLCVPMESDSLWIECTNPRYPLGYRHGSLAGHQVLLVREDGGELVRARSYPDSLRLRSERVDVELYADGTAKCRGQRRLLLDNVESYIGFRALDSKAQFNTVMSGNSFNPVDFSITSVEDNFNDWIMTAPGEEYIPEFRLGYTYAVTDYGKASGDRIFMDMNPFAKRMYSDRTARVNDIEVDTGMTVIDSISVRLPAGYVPESLPSCGVVESQFGLLHTDVSYDENAACVEVVQSLTLYAGRFPKDSYADYRTFARSVSRSYDGKIILVKKQ